MTISTYNSPWLVDSCNRRNAPLLSEKLGILHGILDAAGGPDAEVNMSAAGP